jgi:hypothetical protein
MAQVIQDKELLERIDDYLDYLLKTWKDVPLEAEDWEAWDDFTRLEYELDWGVPNDRLAQLRAWVKESILTPSQQGLYNDLEALIAENQPLLDRMLAE